MRHDTSLPDDSLPVPETDILIGRLVDGEATPDDRGRFETLAGTEPDLWRQLAEVQMDTSHLAAAFAVELAGASSIELPDAAPTSARQADIDAPADRRLSWPLATSGWAAVLIIGCAWIITATIAPGTADRHATEVDQVIGEIDPRSDFMEAGELMSNYMDLDFTAPMPAVLMQTEILPDGRTRVTTMRRIQETYVLTPDEDFEMTDDGPLIIERRPDRPSD